MRHFARQQDGAGTGAEDRLACAELTQWSQQFFFIQKLQHGRAFTARQHQPIDLFEILG